PNYGVIADHPERMDINVPTGGGGGPFGGGGDWFHFNGIDYNPDLDQIALSSRYLSEIFIIDHSPTMAQAATDSGGNSGMGGGFLYRWGNPSNYDQIFGVQNIPAACHDVRWILDDGRRHGGWLQVYNNEGNNGNSRLDRIDTPDSGYVYLRNPGQPYGPTAPDWTHNCLVSSSGQSAGDGMRDGNVFANASGGYMYEVDSLGNLVWQYPAGPAKAFRYHCDYAGITALLGPNACPLVSVEDGLGSEITIAPNPSNGMFAIQGLTALERTELEVTDLYGNLVQRISGVSELDLRSAAAGTYFVRINVEGETPITKKVVLTR
ncbi:MAG: T9SS type A sorting domain-containing protein, partial [Bacteroidota bacterium]